MKYVPSHGMSDSPKDNKEDDKETYASSETENHKLCVTNKDNELWLVVFSETFMDSFNRDKDWTTQLMNYQKHSSLLRTSR